MSLHYPHHVGTVGSRRTERRRRSGAVYRYPRLADPAAIASMRTGGHSDVDLAPRGSIAPNRDASVRESSEFRPSSREAAAVLGAVLVVLITAWLIWGALAEASLARAGLL